jgi:hypothetical protein
MCHIYETTMPKQHRKIKAANEASVKAALFQPELIKNLPSARG